NVLPRLICHMDPPFEYAAAFAADNPAGKSVAVQVFACAFFNSFFTAALCQDALCRFKILPAYDRFMRIFYIIHFFFAMVIMTDKIIIGIGLLKKSIAHILLIFEYPADSRRRPFFPPSGVDAVSVKSFCHGMGASARQNFRK